MAFARQIFRSDAFDFSRFVDTDFAKSDPCLNCSLPFDCDETATECQYVQITNRRPTLEESTDDERDEQLKQDLLAIMQKLLIEN